jgi:hypothetical protein
MWCLARPVPTSRRIFDGLMSRCTRPRACATAKARATCCTIRAASFAGNTPWRSSRSLSGSPLIYSTTRYGREEPGYASPGEEQRCGRASLLRPCALRARSGGVPPLAARRPRPADRPGCGAASAVSNESVLRQASALGNTPRKRKAYGDFLHIFRCDARRISDRLPQVLPGMAVLVGRGHERDAGRL